jgi:hypothetical protein
MNYTFPVLVIYIVTGVVVYFLLISPYLYTKKESYLYL